MIGKADEELKMTLRGAFEKVLHKIIEVLLSHMRGRKAH